MKRTNLVLDAERLEEARRLMGTKTYSETVNKAIEEAVRAIKIRRIPEFFGKGLWIGDLAEMREDNPRRAPRRRKKPS
jgi:putative antitoxin of VapBC-like toxin-antitoxin system